MVVCSSVLSCELILNLAFAVVSMQTTVGRGEEQANSEMSRVFNREPIDAQQKYLVGPQLPLVDPFH